MLYLLVLILTCFSTLSYSAPAHPAHLIDHWLVRAPFEIGQPAFADSTFQCLKADLTDAAALHPRAGAEWNLQDKTELSFAADRNAVQYAATYLELPATMKIRFTVLSSGTKEIEVYLDGARLKGDHGEEKDWARLQAKKTLHRGKHLLLIRGSARGAWKLKASVSALEPDLNAAVTVTTDPRRTLTEFADITLFDGVASPAISADGRYIACVRSHRERVGEYKKEAWIELLDAASGKTLQTIRPLKSPDNLVFSAKGAVLYYSAAGDGGTTIWSVDVERGTTQMVRKGIEGLVKFALSPDGRQLYFTTDAERKSDEDAPQYFDALEDRMSDWTERRTLSVMSLESGAARELTVTGQYALDDFAVSREGDQILLTRRIAKTGRPYYETEFWIYRPATGQATRALALPLPFETRPLSFCWLPGGEKVAFVMARYTTSAADTVHNLSQTGLFVLDLKSGSMKDISVGESFSVDESEGRGAVQWNAREKSLWVKVISGGKVKLLRTDPAAATPVFSEVGISLPFVDEYDVSASGQCVFVGSGSQSPTALYTVDGTAKERPIVLPAADVVGDVRLAPSDSWSFVNADGLTIEGWLYQPVDYKPEMSRAWPLVVYYYAGVSPRDERFNFTYQWWAANGYFVYVLNPVGCVGYGDAFADKHSRDWGTLASRDIIEGTQKLLKAKPFLDKKQVACYGGSYGGFITLDVITKTDLFAAAISDAGISNIASYFGAGSWGFTYGDIALPGAYPWTHPELFVKKSPVFNAEKIHTPLLLIHGSADENVPPTESDQMFVALKLLGRDVAMIRFPGEDHSIALKFKDYVNYREMMLEWFDKYLKKQGDAWDNRWD